MPATASIDFLDLGLSMQRSGPTRSDVNAGEVASPKSLESSVFRDFLQSYFSDSGPSFRPLARDHQHALRLTQRLERELRLERRRHLTLCQELKRRKERSVESVSVHSLSEPLLDSSGDIEDSLSFFDSFAFARNSTPTSMSSTQQLGLTELLTDLPAILMHGKTLLYHLVQLKTRLVECKKSGLLENSRLQSRQSDVRTQTEQVVHQLRGSMLTLSKLQAQMKKLTEELGLESRAVRRRAVSEMRRKIRGEKDETLRLRVEVRRAEKDWRLKKRAVSSLNRKVKDLREHKEMLRIELEELCQDGEGVTAEDDLKTIIIPALESEIRSLEEQLTQRRATLGRTGI